MDIFVSYVLIIATKFDPLLNSLLYCPVYLMTFYSNYKLLRSLISVMIQTQVVWIRQITSKVDIVIWSIQDLLEDIHPATSKEESIYFSYLIETRMRDIVMHHQSMYR